MCLTTLPPRVFWIGKREIDDNRASVFSARSEFLKSFKYNGLFSRA